MVHFVKPNPYDPHYALPKHVLADPPGQRGAITGAYIPRGTYSEGPSGWTGGYAVPKYVMAEPARKGAAHSYGLRRKHIPLKIPSALGYVGHTDIKTLAIPAEVYALDGIDAPATGIPKNDPVRKYGQKVASIIVTELAKVPPHERNAAMRQLFAKLDPKLLGRVKARTAKYKGMGKAPDKAFKGAVASAVSQGFIEQMQSIGKGQKPKPDSLGGIALGIFSTIKDWTKTAVDKIGDVSCKVVSSSEGQTAIAIGGGVIGAKLGGPAGATVGSSAATIGTSLAYKKCNPPQEPSGLLAAITPAGMPTWVVPAAVGGGVLLIALAAAPPKKKP